ncbi:MAG: M24 family metallopeptidase [Anaerolineae bacterium]
MPLNLLRQKMREHNLDGFIVTQAENRRYLSGFTGSAGTLIISGERQIFAADFRYYEQVRQQAPAWTLARVSYDFAGRLPEILDDLGLHSKQVGFESQNVTVNQLESWQEKLQEQASLVPTSGFVEQLRQVKGEDEAAAIRKAVALADAALDYISEWIQPEMTEKQVAWELEVFLRTRGADALAFPPIVAAGPQGALPHARPGERTIAPGEPVVMDLGCVVDGYCSDVTRTFCLGQPSSDKYLEVWNLVQQAVERARAGIYGGISGKAADELARSIIKAAGYGDNFGHSLGHGVGLAVHEGPRLSFRYDDPVPAGAIVTIEPGVYLPGEFGVRLEDMVLVTDGGAEVLTQAPKIAILPR